MIYAELTYLAFLGQVGSFRPKKQSKYDTSIKYNNRRHIIHQNEEVLALAPAGVSQVPHRQKV